MVSCWTYYEYNYGYGMFIIHYTTVGAPDIPELSIPDYVSNDISNGNWVSTPGGFGYQHTLLTAWANAWWGDFCTPPMPAPFDKISTGLKTRDIVKPPSSSELQLYQGHALATRFIPSAICLPYIILSQIVNNAPDDIGDKKLYIEIREEDPTTNLPKGKPFDDEVIARVIMSIPKRQHLTSGGRVLDIEYYNKAIPINAILNSIDTPHWIVLYSEDFICSSAYNSSGYRRFKLYSTTAPGTNFGVYSGNEPACSWNLETLINCFSLITYKTDLCKGVIFVEDFGFAKDTTFVGEECFLKLEDVKNKNVIVGVKCLAPRLLKEVRFDLAYKRPDGTYFTGSKTVNNLVYGSNTIFLDTGELYMTGPLINYTELNVIAEVIKV